MKHSQEKSCCRSLTPGLFGLVVYAVATAYPALADEVAQQKPQAAPAPSSQGMTIHLDPQTGKILPSPAPGSATLQLSPEDQNRMSTSSDGLTERPAPGGGFIVDLKGRFQSPLMATVGPDGKVRMHHLGELPGEASRDHKH